MLKIKGTFQYPDSKNTGPMYPREKKSAEDLLQMVASDLVKLSDEELMPLLKRKSTAHKHRLVKLIQNAIRVSTRKTFIPQAALIFLNKHVQFASNL